MKRLGYDIGKFKDDVVLITKTQTIDEYGGYTETTSEITKPCYIAKVDVKEVYNPEQKNFVYSRRIVIFIRDEGEQFDSFKIEDIEFRVLNKQKASETLLMVEGVSYAT